MNVIPKDIRVRVKIQLVPAQRRALEPIFALQQRFNQIKHTLWSQLDNEMGFLNRFLFLKKNQMRHSLYFHKVKIAKKHVQMWRDSEVFQKVEALFELLNTSEPLQDGSTRALPCREAVHHVMSSLISGAKITNDILIGIIVAGQRLMSEMGRGFMLIFCLSAFATFSRLHIIFKEFLIFSERLYSACVPNLASFPIHNGSLVELPAKLSDVVDIEGLIQNSQELTMCMARVRQETESRSSSVVSLPSKSGKSKKRTPSAAVATAGTGDGVKKEAPKTVEEEASQAAASGKKRKIKSSETEPVPKKKKF